jgi:hypothetical protein
MQAAYKAVQRDGVVFEGDTPKNAAGPRKCGANSLNLPKFRICLRPPDFSTVPHYRRGRLGMFLGKLMPCRWLLGTALAPLFRLMYFIPVAKSDRFP